MKLLIFQMKLKIKILLILISNMISPLNSKNNQYRIFLFFHKNKLILKSKMIFKMIKNNKKTIK